MQTRIFCCANNVGFTLDFTKTSGDPTELLPLLGNFPPGAVDRSESYGHCDDSGSSLGCTYDLRPYCWLYQGRQRPPKELVLGGVDC